MLLGTALIILWMAAPAIIAVFMVARMVAGVGLIGRGVTTGNIGLLVAGSSLLIACSAGGWMAYRFFKGPEPTLPTIVWLDPDPFAGKPAPRIFFDGDNSGWSDGASLLIERRVDHVLRRQPFAWKEPDQAKRLTLFEELRLKPGCYAALDDPLALTRCTEWIPLVIPASVIGEPTVSLAVDHGYIPSRWNDTLAYLSDGTQKRAVARIRAQEAPSVHPISDLLQARATSRVWRTAGERRRELLRLLTEPRAGDAAVIPRYRPHP